MYVVLVFNLLFYLECLVTVIPLHGGLFSAGARECQGGMNRIGWRSGLIPGRCWCEQWRFRDERLRSASTRRHTSRTGADLRTEDLEKRGCFIVMTANKCRVFQCTVNSTRARPKTTLIAVGATGSSRIDAVKLMQCTLRAGTIYKVHVRA